MQIEKTLSANDVGATGSHQAGIVVPKAFASLPFFPALDIDTFNPRQMLQFLDISGGGEPVVVNLNYIYYNGKRHGRSTRDEYRLTSLTRYLEGLEAKAGDSLVLGKEARYYIELRRRDGGLTPEPGVVQLKQRDWLLLSNGKFS